MSNDGSSGPTATVILQFSEEGPVLELKIEDWEMIQLGGVSIDVVSGDLINEAKRRIIITGYIGSKCTIDSPKP